jgi:tetratricopeptide (TPR) repeat protein
MHNKHLTAIIVQLPLLILGSSSMDPIAAAASQTFKDLETKKAQQALTEVKTDLGVNKFLLERAFEAFKAGDHVRAVQFALAMERAWDSSRLRKDLEASSPATETKVDRAMDEFIAAVRRPNTDGIASQHVTDVYRDYHAKLQLRSLSILLADTIKSHGIDAAIEQYRVLKSRQFPDVIVNEDSLNDLGYELLAKGHKDGAVEVFALNVQAYPKSPNVYDSLAEAYADAGNEALSLENYRKAYALDPSLPNASKAVRASARP